MSSSLKSLSEYDPSTIPSAENMRFGIVVSEWNRGITENLYLAAYSTLLQHGASEKNIFRKDVPGSYELCLGALMYAEQEEIDAVICLGCVIQGETRHFDFICDAVANGLMQLSITYKKPVVFGVLTPGNLQQAIDRAGGIHGNKGDEAAITAIKMVHCIK